MDTKLIQGILIAACLCLVLAVAMTWADIAGYGKYKDVQRVAAPAPAPSRPALAIPSAAETEGAPEEAAEPPASVE